VFSVLLNHKLNRRNGAQLSISASNNGDLAGLDITDLLGYVLCEG
jgi:hypothetical protein